MPEQTEFRLTSDQTLDAVAAPDRPGKPAGTIAAAPISDPRTTIQALLATKGGKELVTKIPHLGELTHFHQVASFSVCEKAGSAKYLDIWDADHFDEITDMQRCVTDCRAWFSGTGFTFWGAPETKSGRINCYFQAPSAGDYLCVASLQSDNAEAKVQCLINGTNRGVLTVNGTVHQPYHVRLVAGGHHFRIRQVSGAFFFLRLVVWHVPVLAPA